MPSVSSVSGPVSVLRALLVAGVVAVALTGCESVSGAMDGIFGSSKVPLTGERIAVFGDRGELEPDKDMANVQIVLPAPVVNDSWPQSGGFANYAMQHLAVGDSPKIIWTADVGAGSSSLCWTTLGLRARGLSSSRLMPLSGQASG